MAEKSAVGVGIRRGRAIKHFSPLTRETFGLTPSIIANYSNAKGSMWLGPWYRKGSMG